MIKLIAAVSKNGVIGNNNDLIFKDKEDMKHFKETTTGSIVMMGRKTWESLGSKPLPNRNNIVVTNNPKLLKELWGNPYVDTDTALEYQQDFSKKDMFIIGGGQIYKQMMPHADELIISEFHAEAEGDTFFPEIDDSIWKVREQTEFTNFTLKIYGRK